MHATQICTTFSQNKAATHTLSITAKPDIRQQELNLLNLYPEISYQQVRFFGGAITDAVAATLEQLPLDTARQVLQSYFGSEGIGYQFIRTHIDSCDFSTEPYAAVEKAEDVDFQSFSLQRVESRVIRWILEAYRAAGKVLPVMLSPWSPPAFMKTNRSRTGGGHLEKAYYAQWARYLCRYIQEFRSRGILVTSLSVQNEPNATQSWDSCLFSPEEEQEFLTQHLCPELEKSGLNDVQLYIWDHNKERLFDRAFSVITPQNREKISGVAFHWYSGDHFDAVRLVREVFPEKHLMFSEGCIEYSRFGTNQLENAQLYGHDMIGNLAAGMDQFVDWNICLNDRGGPNYAGNFCEAPILCNTQTGTLSYQLSFYYIRHFSQYLASGARRIASSVYTSDLEQVAFRNPDGTIVLIVLNRREFAFPLTVRLQDHLLDAEIPPASLSTFLLKS